MTFDWREYLTLAKELKDDSITNKNLINARLRTSISRIYYSVFHISKDYLTLSGEKFRQSADVHKKICDRLNELARNEIDETKQKQLSKISYYLEVLRILRNNADYDDELLNNVTKDKLPNSNYTLYNNKNYGKVVERAIEDADEIINIVKSL